jgi:oligopeptide transport system substrate-binding protein
LSPLEVTKQLDRAAAARPSCARCLLISTVALALTVGLGAGCQRSVDGYYGTVTPRHPPNEVWVNNSSEPEYIDPGKCADSAGSTIIVNIFAALTQPHPKTLEPMPDIARSWKISDQGRTYTFYLRPSRWSDGRAVTAHDFEYSWKRVLDPATASKYASFLYPLENGEAFGRRALWITGLDPAVTAARIMGSVAAISPVEQVKVMPERGWAFVWLKAPPASAVVARDRVIAALNGRPLGGAGGDKPLTFKVADQSVVGARALDDLTLEVRLENPVPYFLHLVMFYTAMPVPRHVLERLVSQGQNPDLWTRPEHIVSNGPYVLKEWKFRQYMILEKNPNYWDSANIRINKVRLASVNDENTTLNLYKTGEIDYIGNNSTLPTELIDYLKPFRDYHTNAYLAVYYYWINTKVPPLTDPRVRRALGLAIDRTAIVKFIMRGGQIPWANLVPEGLAGYQGPRSPLFDPDKARALLREAGYNEQHPFPKVHLIYNTAEGHRLIAQAVQEMWKKNLGVEIDIENQEWKVYLKKQTAMDFQISRGAWIGDYPDPFTFLELLSGISGNNHSNWQHPEYERLLAESNRTLDPAARLGLMRKAEEIMLAEMPMIPLYVYTRNDLSKPYLRGFWHNIQNHSIMKYWWIDERFYRGTPDVPTEDPPPPMLLPDPPPGEEKR